MRTKLGWKLVIIWSWVKYGHKLDIYWAKHGFGQKLVKTWDTPIREEHRHLGDDISGEFCVSKLIVRQDCQVNLHIPTTCH